MENKEALKRIEAQTVANWYDMIMIFGWLFALFLTKSATQFLVCFVGILILCQLFEWLEMKNIARRYK